ncbi:hypothetical protein [Aquabacter cavernae]|uniref:hypothetical protein n=1 Tax=Aquabacter cavernae TaxID=2496029 RepID=UPI000F8D2C17|nr:hypothetical protein [Aquabacter cavernae]
MGDYVDHVTKSRRLATLRVVRENEGSANESVLRVCLHQLGFRGRNASDEGLHSDALALQAAGLATVEYYQGKVRTLTITLRGVSYLERRVDPVDGVEYPDVA